MLDIRMLIDLERGKEHKKHNAASRNSSNGIGRIIPRLSKAGMPSRSEGWGGLFKEESTD
jgi:hypothetical protein